MTGIGPRTGKPKCPLASRTPQPCHVVHRFIAENVISRGQCRTVLVVARMERFDAAPVHDPRDALRRAVKSLEDGPADPRTVEGAKVNALESIAWSLVGLLGDRLHAERPSHGRPHTSPDSLSG